MALGTFCHLNVWVVPVTVGTGLVLLPCATRVGTATVMLTLKVPAVVVAM